MPMVMSSNKSDVAVSLAISIATSQGNNIYDVNNDIKTVQRRYFKICMVSLILVTLVAMSHRNLFCDVSRDRKLVQRRYF